MAVSPSVPSSVQGADAALPARTHTGRHRTSSHGPLALRRSTTTPTGIRASAVGFTGLSSSQYMTALTQLVLQMDVGPGRPRAHCQAVGVARDRGAPWPS